jgi:hypothetical protein
MSMNKAGNAIVYLMRQDAEFIFGTPPWYYDYPFGIGRRALYKRKDGTKFVNWEGRRCTVVPCEIKGKTKDWWGNPYYRIRSRP